MASDGSQGPLLSPINEKTGLRRLLPPIQMVKPRRRCALVVTANIDEPSTNAIGMRNTRTTFISGKQRLKNQNIADPLPLPHMADRNSCVVGISYMSE
jgi:hypothetical protein